MPISVVTNYFRKHFKMYYHYLHQVSIRGKKQIFRVLFLFATVPDHFHLSHTSSDVPDPLFIADRSDVTCWKYMTGGK